MNVIYSQFSDIGEYFDATKSARDFGIVDSLLKPVDNPSKSEIQKAQNEFIDKVTETVAPSTSVTPTITDADVERYWNQQWLSGKPAEEIAADKAAFAKSQAAPKVYKGDEASFLNAKAKAGADPQIYNAKDPGLKGYIDHRSQMSNDISFKPETNTPSISEVSQKLASEGSLSKEVSRIASGEGIKPSQYTIEEAVKNANPFTYKAPGSDPVTVNAVRNADPQIYNAQPSTPTLGDWLGKVDPTDGVLSNAEILTGAGVGTAAALALGLGVKKHLKNKKELKKAQEYFREHPRAKKAAGFSAGSSVAHSLINQK